MSDLHIGIDNGQKGALAALSTLQGLLPISILPMPMVKVLDVPQMDVRRIVDWVLEIYPRGDCHIWVEKCPYYARQVGIMRSLAINYGRILGIFEARFPHMIVHRIPCGNVKEGWQQKMGIYEKDKTKENALRLARRIWPEQEWPANRNGKVDDGAVDACLLAEYGRCKTSGEPIPTLANGTETALESSLEPLT